MTTFPTPADSVDPVAQAIAALTVAARQTRVIGHGTANESTVPADFAEIACQVLASVAANVGGVENLLSGRSGSWEASLVRQIIESTAGDDPEALQCYRTEPVRLYIDVEDAFHHFGLSDLYDEAIRVFDEREDSAHFALFEAVATAAERARVTELKELIPDLSKVPEDRWEEVKELMGERAAIFEATVRRGTDEGHPLAAALAAAQKDMRTVEELFAEDQAAYRSAFLSTLHQALSARHFNCGIEAIQAEDEVPEWEPLTDELQEYARVYTPLPMTGNAPNWGEGKPADALRRSGLTYIARVQSA